MSEHKDYGLSGIGKNVEIGKGGSRIKDNGGVIEHRNNADDDFVRSKGAVPSSWPVTTTFALLFRNPRVTKSWLSIGSAPFDLKELVQW